MPELKELVRKYMPAVLEHRRYLHRHPELTGQEKGTAAYIAQALRDIGLRPVENVGGCGVVALIEGRGPGRVVALRADMDALPLTERTGLPFASENPGVMHACGHDSHTAMLLGAACVLNELRDRFDGTVKLIFQPAEEDPMASGARKMIEAGVLECPHVDGAFALHVWPWYEVGKVALRNGAMMASSDRFFITVKGKSSHGSAPEDGVDAIAISAQVISALQHIVSRNVSPLDSAVVTIGKITGGDRYNVIADTVKMEGTCRNLNPAVRKLMPARIENIVQGVCRGMGAAYEFQYFTGYSPTVNDPGQFELVCEAVRETRGGDALVIPASSALTGEDFSFYLERVPGAFMWLGCRDPKVLPEQQAPLHSGEFAPVEEAFPIGIEVMAAAALKFLAEPRDGV